MIQVERMSDRYLFGRRTTGCVKVNHAALAMRCFWQVSGAGSLQGEMC